MRLVLVPLLLLLALLPAPPSTAEEVTLAHLEALNLRLRAEYDLASQKKLYFVFDLPERKIRFKASGVKVAELQLLGINQWGPLGGEGIRSLVAKESFAQPQREVITVGQPKAAGDSDKTADAGKKFELAALELSDMPTSFQLRFDDGTRISVKAAPEGLAQRLGWLLRKPGWLLSRPLISDWNFLRKQSYTELLLTMPAKDAQLLYWSLTDGSNCLLLR